MSGPEPNYFDDDERFKGRPASRRPRMRTDPIDLRRLLHPIAYVRWRVEVHRKGPFAAEFEEFRSRKPSNG